MEISHNDMPTRSIVITVVSALLALPAIALVLQGFFGSIQYDYPSFYIARIVIVLLFVANALIAFWSIRKSLGFSRHLQLMIFLVHCLALAVLLYWFAGVHRA